MHKSKKFILILLAVVMLGYSAKNISAQTSVSYIPLIGITSVPSPSTLPITGGDVTYNYAVKNFLKEAALANVQVSDDKCSPIIFANGDDNGDSSLDYGETWRYACTTRLSGTTESTATVTGISNGITATHKAHVTVVVGSNNPAPIVSIVNVTKVAYPLAGGDITFTYKVNNPGEASLDNVVVTNGNCGAMSGKLGDTNYNQLLDINEVWIYTCTAHLNQSTMDTASVSAYANGLQAVDETSLNITVLPSTVEPSTNLFDVSISPGAETNSNFKIIVWAILSGILVALIVFFVFKRSKNNEDNGQI